MTVCWRTSATGLAVLGLAVVVSGIAIAPISPAAAENRWTNHGGYARGHERHDWGRGGGGGGGGALGGALLGLGIGAVLGGALLAPPPVVYAQPPAPYPPPPVYYAPPPVYYGY
jgi:hypothetical protein